jgi:superfamily II DNA/RNA helicase
LDEADEMLNFGFQDDIEKILGQIPTTQPHQNFFFLLLFQAGLTTLPRNI